MDPERPIEKLLRAYAKKRAEDLGPSADMPPAMRKRLQQEAARRFAKNPAEESSWVALLTRSWPKLAWGVGVCLVLALAILLRPPAATPPADQQQFLAKNTAFSSVPSIADKPLLATNALALSLPAPPKPVGQFLQVSTPQPLEIVSDRDQAVTTTSLSSAEVAQNAVEKVSSPPANSGIAPAQREVETLLAGRPSASQKTEILDAAAAAPEGRVELRRFGFGPQATVRQLVEQAANSYATQRFRQVAVEPATETAKRLDADKTVLSSFEMVQNGAQLSIVDRDGSVYTGIIQTPSPGSAYPRLQQTVAAAKPPAARAAPVSGTAQLARNAALSDVSPQSVQNYFFRVAGTNRSLNQPVIFTANLLGITNGTQAAQSSNRLNELGGRTGAGTFQGTPGLLNFLPQAESRISGKLKIGNEQEVEINAVPAKP